MPAKKHFHMQPYLCFFHRMQSMYRKIQEKRLQVAYNNDEDKTVKEFTHKLTALALVPISDVEASFATLKTQTPVGMEEYIA